MPEIFPAKVGVDFNHFQRFTVNDTSFPDRPQTIIRFRGPHRLIMTIESGTVEYSFNGTTLHGDLVGSTERGKLEFITRSDKKIWFRASSPAEITVEAWHISV